MAGAGHSNCDSMLNGEDEMTSDAYTHAAAFDRIEKDLVDRAEALRPVLRERQAETESQSQYSEEVHELFVDAGFYRMLVPRRFGGLEVGVDTFMQVVTALARGCASTGWALCLGASHALQVGTLFDEATQREIFGDGLFICPTTVAPQGKMVRDTTGEWIINGTFNYCSGSAYATHYMGHAIEEADGPNPPEIHLFVAPRKIWTRLDDWRDTLGLKGSSSNSIKIENGRVASNWVLPNTWFTTVDVSSGTVGEQVHSNPMYAGPPLSFALLEIASLALGIVQGARDEYRELMESKMTPAPPLVPRTQDPTYQRWYGTATAAVDSAEAITRHASSLWMQYCRAGNFTHRKDVEIIGMATEAIELCWNALHQVLLRTAGSSVLRSGSRLERAWRDMSMVRSHNGVVAYSERSRIELGQYP
ncbi:acyl-CoA dehydrogenase family protein [Pseudonocardia sp. NPDC049635]|uniref:acyl-CoA dehydrogenase family protein n=1 Tax=Pseudonocardia sp. NPDC049635 TaxID=3155506 RepID=UPI0033E309F2